MKVTTCYRFVASTKDVAEVLHFVLSKRSPEDQAKENFWTICLNSRNYMRSIHLVAVGVLDEVLLHPREVFRPAIMESAAGIIIGHNHPSGEPTPSEADRNITHRLKGAGVILGIEVIDHVIISEHGYDSVMKEENGDE